MWSKRPAGALRWRADRGSRHPRSNYRPWPAAPRQSPTGSAGECRQASVPPTDRGLRIPSLRRKRVSAPSARNVNPQQLPGIPPSVSNAVNSCPCGIGHEGPDKTGNDQGRGCQNDEDAAPGEHARDRAERARGCGEQEMLRHDDPPANKRTSTFLPDVAAKYKTNSAGGGSYIRANIWGDGLPPVPCC